MNDCSSVGLAVPKGVGVGLSLIFRDASCGHRSRFDWWWGENGDQRRLHCGGCWNRKLRCSVTSPKEACGSICRRRRCFIVVLLWWILISLVMTMATCLHLGQCSRGSK